MKILTLNCGSSSIKFDMIDTDLDKIRANKDESIARGVVERIGLDGAFVKCKLACGKECKKFLDIHNHEEALQQIVDVLTSGEMKVINNLEEIVGVGHRMVHGGERFSKSVLMDGEVEKMIEECSEFAPLHNPQNLVGLRVARKFFPNVPHVGVFDTGFHTTMPAHAFMYSIPYECYDKHRMRRYGFHGTSHRYVSQRAAEILGKPYDQCRLITAHLGNGCSITAIKNGQSIDTSMGHTPLEGLMMGTRCGDIDPALVLQIMKKYNLTAQGVDDLLNKKSGIAAISGISSDLREVEDAYMAGHERATLGLQMYSYRIKKYIGAYASALGGIDAIVFTGGVGEKSPIIRGMTIKDLDFMGVAIDLEKNEKAFGVEADISTATAKVRTLVIPTNEELIIARDTITCIQKR